MASASSFPSEIVEYGSLNANESSSTRARSGGSSRLYDVFVNHRGPDVKHTLALLLYNSIKKMGFRPFLDSQEIELGDSIPSILKNAINSASVHIAIFSQGYARSAWCLAELAIIIQTGVKIIPVFYDVSPSDLRYIEKGVYAAAFATFKEKGRYLDQLEEWKRVLHFVSLISGYECNTHNNDYEKLCEIIMSAVLKEFKRISPLDVAKHSVGLDELVEDFESFSRRHMGKKAFQVTGIFGKGGSGKTTLAKEFFNRKRSGYDGSSFLFDVRETAKKGELPWLQTKLLKDLLMEDRPKFHGTDEGIIYLRNCLAKALLQRFLIVIDDIDHIGQLDALLVTDMLNPDSLVIVTTRDEKMLFRASIPLRYRMKEMNENHSRELFCWHAFQQPYPSRGFEDLVESFRIGCAGLPLSLQMLGSHVYGKTDRRYWQMEIDKLCKTVPGDINQSLKICYAALDREEKEIFMDVACFFIGKQKSIAIRIWEGSGWKTEHALQTLKDKSLVFEADAEMIYWEDKWLMMNKPDAILGMHDHVRDFGREMADGERHTCRFWCPQDLKSMELKGFQNILNETNYYSFRCFHSFFDSSVGGRITFFLGNSDGCSETSTVLLSLELYLREAKLISIPSWIPLRNLQRLRIVFGCLKRLWYDNAQAPLQLKELVLQQISLEEISSSLGMLNQLQDLVIKGKSERENHMLTSGRSLSETLKKLTKLRRLILCQLRLDLQPSLKYGGESSSLDSFVGIPLQNIQIWDLLHAWNISISGEHCPDLEYVHLESLENLAAVDLKNVHTLNSLTLRFCGDLKKLSRSFDRYARPARLHIHECQHLGLTAYSRKMKSLSGSSDIKRFGQDSFEDFSWLDSTIINGCWSLRNVKGIELEGLKSLYLSGRGGGVSKLSVSGEHSPNLEFLDLESMENLIELDLTCLTEIKSLTFRSCERLITVSGSLDMARKLVMLEIEKCSQLTQFPSLAGLSCLESIIINGCQNLEIIGSALKLEGLKSLHLTGDKGLSKLSISGEHCPNLESIHLESMTNLFEMDLRCVSTLHSLTVRFCGELRKISRSFDMIAKPATLCIQNCQQLGLMAYSRKLKTLSGSFDIKSSGLWSFNIEDLRWLETTIINGCQNFQSIKGIELEGLKSLHLSGREGGVSKLSISGEHSPNLESLHLESMENLIELDLTCVTTLKSLTFRSCRRLITISGSLDMAKKLAMLKIDQCPQLAPFPSLRGLSCLERIVINGYLHPHIVEEIVKLEGLKSLSISGIREGVSKLSISGEHCPNLKSLSLEYMEFLIELDLRCVSTLHALTLRFCSRLKKISRSFDIGAKPATLYIQTCQQLELMTYSRKLKTLSGSSVMKSFAQGSFNVEDLSWLETTMINGCFNLQNIKGIELESLKCLHLSGSKGGVSNLSISGEHSPNLESLHLESMENLIELDLTCVTALKSLTFRSCRRLIIISGSFDMAKKLSTLKIEQCPNLTLFPSLAGLTCLQRIIFNGYLNLQILDGIEKLEGLKSLHISNSGGDVSKLLNSAKHCPNLESVHLENMKNLIELDLNCVTELKSLTFRSCRSLITIDGNFDMAKKIGILKIEDCPQLVAFPKLACLSCLENIIISGCINLQIKNEIGMLKGLKSLHLSGIERGVSKVSISGKRFPNLEFLHLESMKNLIELDLICLNRLHSLTLRFCGELKKISRSFDTAVKPATLDIQKCQQLELMAYSKKLKMLSGSFDIKSCDLGSSYVEDLSLLENTIINESWNLQNIEGVELEGLKSLHLSGRGGGVSKLSIYGEKWPNLEFLHLESMENMIELELRLSKSLKSLTLRSCKTLKRITGNLCTASNLVILDIRDCAELEEWGCLASMGRLERIILHYCLKLHNLQGIEELNRLKYLNISGINKALYNCIPRLQRLPSEVTVIIGEAFKDVNETSHWSYLNSVLLPSVVGADAVSGIHSSVSQQDFNGLNSILIDKLRTQRALSAIIVCALIETSDSLEKLGILLSPNNLVETQVKSGQWMATIVIAGQEEVNQAQQNIYEWIPRAPSGALKNVLMVTMNKGKEWEARVLLRLITARMYKRLS
ncbi:disease resistance protein RPP5-like [Cryptomeria japonica]|uniref:disease resistance protein RPP5-like n=1 Tax=Cryptomeria japonica TaxID=3369 RepID=UPI0027DA7A88|nr:disease resistance protein RPP5-like [Cryptomeria japonica]